MYHINKYCQGTGSYPNPPPGLQRQIRLNPRQLPRHTPYFSIPVFVYSLHVGVNLHAFRPPNMGDKMRWYIFTSDIAVFLQKDILLGI